MDIFCKIVAGQVPCHKVAENDLALAFLDISQVTPGHTLVIPKAHATSLLDCPRESYLAVMELAASVATLLVDRLGCPGVNLVSNANEVAGQSVPHFHVHLIPRYGDDDGYRQTWKGANGGDLEATLRRIVQ